jgi:trehalose-phosphatase
MAPSSFIYAGNHGLEIQGPDFHFVEPAAGEAVEELHRITEGLSRNLADVAGVVVEVKGLTTSVHFRMVGISQVDMVIRSAAKTVGNNSGFLITAGKKVCEIRPAVDWNKGAAALWITHRLRAGDWLPICIGDDQTDEDAFAALPQDIRIRVGTAETSLAEYRVENSGQVLQFLSWLADHI